MFHQMIVKIIPTIVLFTLLILVNQNICDGYEPRRLYGRKDAINATLSFVFGINFISRYFR